jgi:hypothetical protein
MVEQAVGAPSVPAPAASVMLMTAGVVVAMLVAKIAVLE